MTYEQDILSYNKKNLFKVQKSYRIPAISAFNKQ